MEAKFIISGEKIVNPLKQKAKQHISTLAFHYIPKRERERKTKTRLCRQNQLYPNSRRVEIDKSIMTVQSLIILLPISTHPGLDI
jgi:hypothetical protein